MERPPILTDEEFAELEMDYCKKNKLPFPLHGAYRDLCNRIFQLAADLKWFVQWGESPCPHYQGWDNYHKLLKEECRKCWLELKELAEGSGED